MLSNYELQWGQRKPNKAIVLNIILHVAQKLNLCMQPCDEATTNDSFNKHTSVYTCGL